MTTERKSEGEPTSSANYPHVTCPYDKDHKVPPIEFNFHIMKCRAKYMESDPYALKMIQCSFNPCHYLPKPEIKLHEKICESQGLYPRIEKDLQIEPIVIDVQDFRDRQLEPRAPRHATPADDDYEEEWERRMRIRREKLDGLVTESNSSEEEFETSSEVDESDEDEDQKRIVTRNMIKDMMQKMGIAENSAKLNQ